jgi:biopolymer transport protein ExbD
MRIARPARPRRLHESVVPMINVVFLLLVFLMITADLAPPPPLPVEPPRAAAGPPPPGAVEVTAAADGTLAMGALRGAAVLAALPPDGGVLLRADAGMPAAELARLLPLLSGGGARRVHLVAVPP